MSKPNRDVLAAIHLIQEAMIETAGPLHFSCVSIQTMSNTVQVRTGHLLADEIAVGETSLDKLARELQVAIDRRDAIDAKRAKVVIVESIAVR